MPIGVLSSYKYTDLCLKSLKLHDFLIFEQVFLI